MNVGSERNENKRVKRRLDEKGICSFFEGMPEPYWPKQKHAYTLSMAERNRTIVRVHCRYCKRMVHYPPADLILIFGDAEVDDLAEKMKCEAGNHGSLDVKCIMPSAGEAVGIKLRRLVRIHLKRIPIWKDD